MDFADQLKQFSKRVQSVYPGLETEEATKMSIIVPFFAMLGYDVFNPDEFIPEFTADVGIKKGEKVDYAILKNGAPMVLIEAKWCGEKLNGHDSQLFRYFGTTKAKFAILTNGLLYNFYTDLEAPNKMDEKPFLVIDILNIKDSQIVELKKFTKAAFDIDSILNTASELKYSNEFKQAFANELQSPSDEFTRYFLSSAYSGRLTQNVMEKFKPILKKALNNYISEVMNDKITSALNQSDMQGEDDHSPAQIESTSDTDAHSKIIITTNEELEAYFIVKNLLSEKAPMSDITYRDTVNYINILYKDNGRKWICRLILNESQKSILIPDENKVPVKHTITDIYDIRNFKSELENVLERYID